MPDKYAGFLFTPQLEGLSRYYPDDRAPARISSWPGFHARLIYGNRVNGGVGAAAAEMGGINVSGIKGIAVTEMGALL